MNSSSIQKVMICSRQRLYCDTLANIVSQSCESIEIVSIQFNHIHAFEKIVSLNVEYLLLSIDYAIKNPVDFIQEFKLRFPNVKLVALTLWDCPIFHNRLINAGVFAFYVTSSNIEHLLRSLEDDKLTLPQKLKGVG